MKDHSNPASNHLDYTYHKGWVRICHWLVTISFLILVYSGFEILKVHPRLYWGEVGNDLTPALFEIPVSRNYKHGGWDKSKPFSEIENPAVSASRIYDIYNQNGWARSLHFLAAWFLVLAGLYYLMAGFVSKHFKNHIWPKGHELSRKLLWADLVNHFRFRIAPAKWGPKYGVLQKFVYVKVIFLLLPLVIITGFAMSPNITASYPFISDIFGGFQSARTIHFFVSGSLVLFLIVHFTMVILSGFRQQIRGMTIGKRNEK